MNILMVCLGNICRSPLAEGILSEMVRIKGLDWQVDSAGTGAWHRGEAPDPRAIATAQKSGIDISRQRARQVQKQDFFLFDRILVMDEEVYRDVLALGGQKAQKGQVDYITNLAWPGKNLIVPDPYNDDDGFGEVFRLLHESCAALSGVRLPEADSIFNS